MIKLLRTKISQYLPTLLHSLDKDILDAHRIQGNSAKGWESRNKHSFLPSNSSWSNGNNIHTLIAMPYRKCCHRNMSGCSWPWKKLYESRAQVSQESFAEKAILVLQENANLQEKRREVAKNLEGSQWNTKEKNPNMQKQHVNLSQNQLIAEHKEQWRCWNK